MDQHSEILPLLDLSNMTSGSSTGAQLLETLRPCGDKDKPAEVVLPFPLVVNWHLETGQKNSPRSGKMKCSRVQNGRTHPYKFPFKCDKNPRCNTAGVFEYPGWDVPSFDQKSGALDVLDLKKVSYLGGPDKYDVMLCESNQDTKKKFVLRFFPRKSERFIREHRAVKGIRHPNIVKPISFRILGNISYMVTNYFPRGSLTRYIGEMDICTIVRYFIKIANALAFLHSCHVFHRDLRPENIMIDDCDNPKISDFDMSDTLRPGACIRDGKRQIEMDINFARRYGTKKDAFSLGAVLHCMLFEVPYHEHYDFYDQAKNVKMPDSTILQLLKWISFSRTIVFLLKEIILNLVTPDWSARWNIHNVLELFVKHHALLPQFCGVQTLEKLDPLFAKMVKRSSSPPKDAFSLGAVLHCMLFEVPYHEHYDFYDQAKNVKMPDSTILQLLKEIILNLVTPDWSARWNINNVLELLVKHHALLPQFCGVQTLEKLDPLFAKMKEAFSLGAVLHCMLFEVPYHENYDFYDQAKNVKMPDSTILQLLKEIILNLVTPDWSARWNINNVLELLVKHHALLPQFCGVQTLEKLDPLFAKMVKRVKTGRLYVLYIVQTAKLYVLYSVKTGRLKVLYSVQRAELYVLYSVQTAELYGLYSL
ncbi:hypothetical protein EGW08_022123 [Elysia chlorotica]|uniref:Protein kinase domain-containing protein n=1 Tax=Elysia chlorotica TaxID=188477 RepID=A0A3S0Z625_ELYCH|nr:hypothetical protein EGW08_022123 [Elysia chlorotica]